MKDRVGLLALAVSSAAVAAAASYLLRDWLLFLMLGWILLFSGGAWLFRNHFYRAVAFGALFGLSLTLGFLMWLHDKQ